MKLRKKWYKEKYEEHPINKLKKLKSIYKRKNQFIKKKILRSFSRYILRYACRWMLAVAEDNSLKTPKRKISLCLENQL